jgi:hypothetical protein
MAFANILDISSFFIGMLINLLLIALICYYFKRKYETLELAQNEQAKILYSLIQQNKKTFQVDSVVQGVQEINLDKVNTDLVSDSEEDSDSDSDSDSESDIESNRGSEEKFQPFQPTVVENEVKHIQVIIDSSLEEPEEVVVTKVEVEDYSKLTIKELRDVLSKKGITSNNKMKKNDLLQLIETGVQDTLNLSEELNEVNI